MAVLPQHIEACIPPPDATLGESMRLVIMKMNDLWAQWYGSVYNEDGSFTNAFAQMVCDARAECED